jgi:bacterioferritin (cytochrome b1)
MSKILLNKLSTILASSEHKPAASDPVAEDRLDAVLEDHRDVIAVLEDHLDVIAAAGAHSGHSSHHSSQID